MQIIVILYSLFLTLKSQKSIIVHVACKNAKKQLKRLKMLIFSKHIYLTKIHKFSIILKPVSKRHQNKVFEN